MQKAIKEKNIDMLLIELEKHINEESAEDHVCEAMVCYQYITRRLNRFQYKNAIKNDSPMVREGLKVAIDPLFKEG